MADMEQERADYDDQAGRRRRPWTLMQIAILIVIALLSIPLLLVAVLVVGIVLSGGMQY